MVLGISGAPGAGAGALPPNTVGLMPPSIHMQQKDPPKHPDVALEKIMPHWRVLDIGIDICGIWKGNELSSWLLFF